MEICLLGLLFPSTIDESIAKGCGFGNFAWVEQMGRCTIHVHNHAFDSIHIDVHSSTLMLLFVRCAWIVLPEQREDFLLVVDLYWHLYIILCMQIN